MANWEDVITKVEALIENGAFFSNWVKIDQYKLDKHAEVTGDADWLHNNPERAAKESPYDGKTIAQGFLVLSHLTQFLAERLPMEGDNFYALNYGSNKVRFISPVPVGSRIRGKIAIKEMIKKDEGRFLVISENAIELEGSNKPAVVAEWRALYLQT